MSEIHTERHEYNRWLDGVRDSGVSPTLADYRKWAEFDGNLFWRLSCGDHQNLLDEAIAAANRVPFLLAEMEWLQDQPQRILNATLGLGLTEPTEGDSRDR